jgi:rhodanese-related sulfurtransferase
MEKMEQVLKSFTLDFFGKGKHQVSPAAFFELDDVILLDVRSKEEAASLSIGLAHHDNVQCINIPINEVPDRLSDIPMDKSIAIFCPSGVRSAIGFSFLLAKGFSDVRILMGGYPALMEEVMPGKVLQLTLQKI